MSYTIKKEETILNTSPVDSVGGAKPEPEERPLDTRQLVENIADLQRGPVPVHAFVPKTAIITRSEVVATAMNRLGKQCGHCKHFNVPAGKYLLEQIQLKSKAGDPIATNFVRSLRAYAIGTSGGSRDPEIYSSNVRAPDVVDEYLAELGLCKAYSSLMSDVMLMHPAETCPEDEGLQEMADFLAGWPESAKDKLVGLKVSEVLAHESRPKPLPIMYEAADSTVEKFTQELLDNVMRLGDEAKKA